jgi:O-succinylbenzoic acid--CoA ligase
MQRWQRTAAAALKRAAPKASDVVWIFSSGTQSVGRVKAIGLSFEAIWESARAVNAHLQATSKDIWSIDIPAYHVGGFSILARARLCNAKVVRGGIWEPERSVRKLKSRKVTLTSFVPTQVFDLVEKKLAAPKYLRAVVVGGGALDSSLYSRARELGWPLLPSYGLTECASHVRDGWFITEDLGEWKGIPIAGRPPQIRILGRQDEVVKVYGVLVSLPQVESDLRRFCGGVGGSWTVVALGGGREGARVIVVSEDLRDTSALELAVRKYNASVTGPHRIHEVKAASIPRTSLGKVKRAELIGALIEK